VTYNSLTLTGDEATGTVWIPASLVYDNSDTLEWIADLNLLSAEDPRGVSLFMAYAVPSGPRMG